MNRSQLQDSGLGLILMVVALGAGVPTAHAGEPRRAPGEQDRWTIRFHAQLNQPGQERPIDFALSGEWISTISAVRSREYDAALELANITISGDGVKKVPDSARKQVERRLTRRFWATYRNDGALLSVHFLKEMSPSDRNLLQMIATEIQLVRASAEAPVWTVLERDGGGEYLAIYNRLDALGLMKRKLKYVYTDGAPDAPANGIQLGVEQSEIRFSFDADGGIAACDGSNRVRIGPAGGDALITVTETHMANHRKSLVLEEAGSLSRSLSGVVSLPVATHMADPDEARAQGDEQLIEGHTTNSLLEAATSKSGDALLGYRLAALFRRRADATVPAIALLRKSGRHQQITDALASAGSPAAIGALGSIAADPAMSRPVRIDALNALVLVRHPNLEAMRLPAALLDDEDPRIASAARMAFGALARAGRAAHPMDANHLDALLLARYRRAREAGERSNLLAAFGNSAGPDVLPAIETVLRDRHDPLRAVAARALRLAGGPDIDRVLSTTIASDEDPGVRAAAIFAAGFRHPLGPILGEALVHAASVDAVDYVRSSAITLLCQNPSASPDIAKTLAWIAEHDPTPGVRRLARESLGSPSGQETVTK